MQEDTKSPTVIDEKNSYRFLHILLDMGVGMLCSGAEINRVEENILKVGSFYNVKEVNVFVIPSMITVTLRVNEVFELTQTRRIKPQSISVNLNRLEKLNGICHRLRDRQFSLDELDAAIKDSDVSVAPLRFVIGSIIAAASFTLFFGGSFTDALASALIALIVCLLQRKVSPYISNRIIFNFICALTVGLVSGFAANYIFLFNNDKVIIGNIMLIVPGIAFTVSVRDIILEDTISGSLKLIDSLFMAGGLALGILVSFLLRGV